jgi:hypothetical protein
MSGNHQYDYEKTAPVLEMTKGLQITLSYKECASRYDIELRNFLEEFKRTKKIPINILKPINEMLETNISYYRSGGAKTLEKVNQQHFKGFKKGVPVICTETYICKKYSLFHNQLFIIDKYDIRNNTVLLHFREDCSTQINVTMVHFKKYFQESYCFTIYSIQGCTLHDNYNIRDVNRFSFNMLYTALSRAKTLSQIHIGDFESNHVFRVETPKCVCDYLEFSLEHVKSTCYQILYKRVPIYIGITQQPDPTSRWSQHISSSGDKQLTPLKEFMSDKLITDFEFKKTHELNITNRFILLDFEKELILSYIQANPLHMLFNQQNIKIKCNKRKLDEIVIDVEMGNLFLRDRRLPTARLCVKKSQILVKFFKDSSSVTRCEKKFGFTQCGFQTAYDNMYKEFPNVIIVESLRNYLNELAKI